MHSLDNESLRGQETLLAAPISRQNYFNNIDYKAASFRSTAHGAEQLYDLKRKSAVWDPKLRRYRCKPGLRFGGRITNRMGAGCGGNIIRRLIRGVAEAATGDINTPKPRGVRGTGEIGRAVRGARRGARAAAGRTISAANTASELARGDDQIPEGGHNLRRVTPSVNLSAVPKLGAWGRALARFADAIDVDDDSEIADLPARLQLPRDKPMTAKRKRKLLAIGRTLETLGDRVEQVATPERDRDRDRTPDRPDVPDADAPDAPNSRRIQRERRGIQRRERQIDRRRRLAEFAERVDVDEDPDEIVEGLASREGDYIETGGTMAIPDRRRIDQEFFEEIAFARNQLRERYIEAARVEHREMDKWWADRLNKVDFTFDDITKHIRAEGKRGVDEKELEELRRLRNDWAELHAVFGLDRDREVPDVLNHIARLHADRKRRIIDRADVDRTIREKRIAKAKAVREAEARAEQFRREAKEAFQAEERRAELYEEALRAGNLGNNLKESKGKVEELIREVEAKKRASSDRRHQFDRELREAQRANDVEAIQRLEALSQSQKFIWEQHVANRLLERLNRLKADVEEWWAVEGAIDPVREITEPGQFVLYPDAPALPANFGRVGHIGENGLPILARIENPRIKTEEDAIQFVAEGGDLADLPNEFWIKALKANSSNQKVDANKRFFRHRDKPGMMGDTQIFLVRNEKGEAEFRGWILKYQRAQGANKDERFSWITYAMGTGNAQMIPGEDGRLGDELSNFVILPHAGNIAQDGKLVRPSLRNYNAEEVFRDLPDKAMPQRLHGLLNNYIRGIRDRHSNNGITYKAGDKGYVIPIDYGGFIDTNEAGDDLRAYASSFSMDPRLDNNINKHLSDLWARDPDEAVRQARQIVNAYDGFVVGVGQLRNIPDEAVWDQVKNTPAHGKPSDAEFDLFKEDIEAVRRRIGVLEAKRKVYLNKMIPAEVLGRLNDESPKEVALANPPMVGRDFIPSNEIRVRSDLRSLESAVSHLKDGGNLAEVPDNILFDAMLDEQFGNLRTRGGGQVDPKRFLDEPHGFEQGDVLENDRFHFRVIKNESYFWERGPWMAAEVRDKDTGEKFIMKANNFGVAEAVGEIIGADFARLVGFKQEDRRGAVRIGEVKQGLDDNFEWRWIMVPHIDNFLDRKDNWRLLEEAMMDVPGGGGREDVLPKMKINERDAAKMAVMDYLLNNTDRHKGNYFVGGEYNNLRLHPIDHGLIGALRRDLHDLGEEWDGRLDSPTLMQNILAQNPLDWVDDQLWGSLFFDLSKMRPDAAYRERLEKEIAAILKKFEQIDIDNLLSPDRLGRRGVRWTSTELQHIEAIKEIFKTRLEHLRGRPDRLVRALG